MRSTLKYLFTCTTLSLVSVGIATACGGSDTSNNSRYDTVPDAGADVAVAPPAGGMGGQLFGAAGTGGATNGGSGGAGGAAGGAGGASADAGACEPTAQIDPTLFPTCDLCPAARCVPNSLVPADVSDQLADCSATEKCVPDDFVATAGVFLLEACRSLEDAEGRCVPSCLPAVGSKADYLPVDICADGEVCAPCYDPTTGLETGACGVSCDPGPTEAPVTFQKCCGGIGSCVPAALVPTNLQASLGPDECTDTTKLCAPDAFVDSTFQPATCRSLGDAEGRCIPSCVPAVQERADSLPQDTCAAGELCAPCYDPITGESTGSCEINGDQPVEAPVVFATCCNDLGTCVPTSAVPTDQQAMLSTDTCTAAGDLCAPTKLIDTSYQPVTCDSVGGFEGRCLPACLPDIQAQADRLSQDVCDTGELCAPCYDPVTGDATGACTLNGDSPAQPPGAFDTCCSGLGTCVPESLVPTDQQSMLSADTCTDVGYLCAPTDLTDPNFVPTTCASLVGAEGRCLPACLPDVASQADRLPQDICDDNYLCAPCYDPITGLSTGACELNGDTPAQPPIVFESCCSGGGTCVPMTLVPADQQAMLAADSCSTVGDLCVPTELTDSTFQPMTCDSVGGFEGRCLSTCLPDIAAQADRLPRDICATDELCAPCYDPITGLSTGACELNGDTPVQPPGTFQECCGGIGTCVPTSLVPVDQQSMLSTDTCTDQGVLCVPDKLTDAAYVPPSCTSLAGAEGRCLAACLPDIAAQADRLPQDTCSAGELCAPCYDPITGVATGACELNGDAPTQPPVVFDSCCGGIGTCVPTALVPTDQQSLLGTDTCTNGGDLCVPTVLTDSSYVPPSCNSVGGFEGRCLAACLPDIAAQADQLPQDSCGTGELCAPCYDPITGVSTGACEINGDSPTQPVGTFEDCCGGIGSCVPTSLVPADQQSMLSTDTCSTGGVLCVPDKLTDTTYVPTTCSSIAGAEGRCLAACLPDIAAQADMLPRDVCDAGELCAPCYDPITGVSTGACDLNGDAPVNAPYVFPTCCNDGGTTYGRCVPTSILSASQASSLPQDSCAAGFTCAPDAKVADPNAPLPSCSYPALALACGVFSLGCPGACLHSCFVQLDPVQSLAVTQQDCQSGELCAPCSDPLAGTSTGACD